MLFSAFFLLFFLSPIENDASDTFRNINSRIIGGYPAHISQFPFVAAINVEAPGMTWFWGGTLYNDEWIITAGQCVNQATHFIIRLGSATLNDPDENRITLSASTYFLHPDFNPDTLDNDIGMIKLHLPITFTDYVKPVTYLAMNDLLPNTQVRALGWGQTNDEDAGLSNELQGATVITLTNDECKITYGSQVKDNMVCIDGNYNEGACHGDTGGPLVLMHPRGYAEFVGISSFISANGCESPDPSGYTRVYSHLDWIKGVITDNSI
ncbi:brachyurin-like [Zophobas morio]|uniref:brachyurin-like n=1 Tax=Zophobas morio TaxID=2755281 RepID=UPI003083C65E